MRNFNSSAPIGFMDYDSVFHDHPKVWVTKDAFVEVHSEAEESIERAIKGGFFSPSPLAGFSDDLDRRIVDTCRSRGRISIATLVTELQSATNGPSLIAIQVSRLVKYGLLSLIPTIPTECNSQEYQDATDSNFALSQVGI